MLLTSSALFTADSLPLNWIDKLRINKIFIGNDDKGSFSLASFVGNNVSNSDPRLYLPWPPCCIAQGVTVAGVIGPNFVNRNLAYCNISCNWVLNEADTLKSSSILICSMSEQSIYMHNGMHEAMLIKGRNLNYSWIKWHLYKN